jgi:hypothetical protein
LNERYKRTGRQEEDVSIYWINLRERDGAGILDKKH